MRLFLSDLHLHDSRPEITQLFCDFLRSKTLLDASEVFILGDLFEFWAGDDAGAYTNVLDALAKAADLGIKFYFMPGNRDFLVGKEFEKRSRCQLLPDPSVITVGQERVLLMHGDTLCTDDIEYQAFRTKARSDVWQNQLLSMPLSERLRYIQSLRESSKESIQKKTDFIMDVNQQTVEQTMLLYDCQLLIHGHTHRKAIHHLTVKDRPAVRIVLGDWYKSGNVLQLNSVTDYQFIDLSLPA
jgi:UDP-2,3-diacylglucosamine hydrolase